MPIILKFYLDRAAESARAAKGAQTSDLRNQHLTSELAWRAMADKLIEFPHAK
jgi:hypothetical protein